MKDKKRENMEEKKAEGLIVKTEIANNQISVSVVLCRIEPNSQDYEIFLEAMQICLRSILKIGSEDCVRLEKIIVSAIKSGEKKVQEYLKDSFAGNSKSSGTMQKNLRIFFNEKEIVFHLSGRNPQKGKDGYLDNFGFRLEDVPEAEKSADFDFYQLAKYPFVEKGIKLFTVFHAVPGIDGYAYDCKVIKTKNVVEYEVKIMEGAEVKPLYLEDGKNIGFEVFSNRSGLVLPLLDENSMIRSIGVFSEIVTKKDFGAKIGSKKDCEIFSPVSVKFLGFVGQGVKVEGMRNIFVNEAYGAKIKCSENAVVKSAYEKSYIEARDAGVVIIKDSSVFCTNKVKIFSEAVNSVIIAGNLVISEKTESHLSGLRAEVNCAKINNVRFSGENNILLGMELFKKFKKMNARIEAEKKNIVYIKQDLAQAKDNIEKALGKIKKQLRRDDPNFAVFSNIRDNFLWLCEKISELRTTDIKSIAIIENNFSLLRKLVENLHAKKNELVVLEQEGEKLEKELSGIVISVVGEFKVASFFNVFVKKEKYIFSTDDEKKPSKLDVLFHYDNSERKFVLNNNSTNVLYKIEIQTEE